MKLKKITPLCMIITLVSILGFLVENIWLAITKGYINNRNMCLPFLFGYGLAVAAIFLLFGTPIKPRFLSFSIDTGKRALNLLIYFLIVCVCVSVGECLLGTVVEKTTGIVWWNYSNIPLHITKYTSLPTTLLFSTMITAFMRFFFIPIYSAVEKRSGRVLGIIAIALMAVMTADLVNTALRMLITGKHFLLWRINLR